MQEPNILYVKETPVTCESPFGHLCFRCCLGLLISEKLYLLTVELQKTTIM